MGQASRDPLFWAALDVANATVNDSGEWCMRCHTPRAWYEGRSVPTDGSGLEADDYGGIECSVCHRAVDPVFSAENPAIDQDIIAAINPPLTTIGSGALILDPFDRRRGPFDVIGDIGFDPHGGFAGDTQISPYHREALLCASCHDINNPTISWDEDRGEYWLNDLDTPIGDQTGAFPIERTYSEWSLSDYNTPEGIFAPQFGGNRDFVSTCQDCHMRDITGKAAHQGIERDDQPLHDLTGANTWIPQTLPLHPEFGADFADGDSVTERRARALEAGIERARYMLQNAATVEVFQIGNTLGVTVTNESGHKLPTGYPEGRRMWLQIEGYDESNNLIYQSGAYDVATGDLTVDADIQIYEVKQGLSDAFAAELGLPAGPSFHFALNNVIVTDNRIPPRGYEFTAFDAVGAAPHSDGAPDPTLYADGEHWDVTTYQMPMGVVSGTVRLLYQTASKEYVTWLRDNNPNAGTNNGDILYDLWEQTDRSAPEVMAEVPFTLDDPSAVGLQSSAITTQTNGIVIISALILFVLTARKVQLRRRS